MLDLMNIPGTSEVINKVIDKISSAIGWQFTRDTPERIAVQSYIDDIKKENYSPLEKAALIYNSRKTVKEYANQINILQSALPNIEDTANPQDVDDDWLSEFFEDVKNISNAQIQKVWGKILAGEINNPGSVSLRLVDAVKKITSDEAQCFVTAASLAVQHNHDYVLLNLFNVKEKISQENIFSLEECGFLSGEVLAYTVPLEKQKKEIICYNKEVVMLGENLQQKAKLLTVSCYRFTKLGQQLLNIIQVKANNKFILEKATELQNDEDNTNIKFSVHKINSFLADGIEYDEQPYQGEN